MNMEILWLVVEERGYVMYDVEFADNTRLRLKESIIFVLFLFQLLMIINWWISKISKI